MHLITILKNNRKFFLIQFLWSAFYTGIALMLLIAAVFSEPTTFFSGQQSPAEWWVWSLLLSEIAVFITLTASYIFYGKKHLPEWNGKYIAASFGIMIVSVPVMTLAMKACGVI